MRIILSWSQWGNEPEIAAQTVNSAGVTVKLRPRLPTAI